MDFFFKLTDKGHPCLYISLEQASTEIFLYLIQKYTAFAPLNIKQGNLKGQKVMGRWFVSEEELEEFFNKLTLPAA